MPLEHENPRSYYGDTVTVRQPMRPLYCMLKHARESWENLL
jgi:hypothetical protein